MSHTPGPWYRDGYKNDVVRSAIVRDATGFEVALTRHWGVHETKANANLIAAAPEMLECLQATIDYLGFFATKEANELWGKVAMVIRKANGIKP